MSEANLSATVFTNVHVFDGSTRAARPGEVRVDADRITVVSANGDTVSRAGAAVIDGGGATLMPGLIDAHAHLTFPYAFDRPSQGLMPPAGEQYFATIHNAKVLLDAGYTSAFSGGSMNAELEVRLKREIEAGHLPGPRLRACSFERGVSGGPPGQKIEFDESASSVPTVTAWVKEMAALGCDNVKMILDGRSAVEPDFWHLLNYKEDAVASAARTARELGMKLACHAMTADGVKQAARNDFNIIYHAFFLDDEAMDLLEEKKETLFVAPAIGILYTDAHEGGFSPEMVEKRGSKRALAAACETYQKLRARGVHILPGGDYGFPHNPHGTEARDLQHFVDLLGFSPEQALQAATMGGARLMGMETSIGQIQPGFLADVLLVDGDPTRDVRMLQDRQRIAAIMKGGRFHKAPAGLQGAAAR